MIKNRRRLSRETTLRKRRRDPAYASAMPWNWQLCNDCQHLVPLTQTERAVPLHLIQPSVLNLSIQIAGHGRGKIITPTNSLDVKIAEGFGTASVHVTNEFRIVSVATVAWLPADDNYAWEGLQKIRDQMHARPLHSLIASDVVKPLICPWLGIIVAPEFVNEHGADEIAWLENLQWALAWGILEKHSTIGASN